MEIDSLLEMTRASMIETMLLAGPLLLVALAVGALTGMLQAITQIQDATISLVPKIIGVSLAIVLCLPWFAEHMLDFAQRYFGTLPYFLDGG